MKNEETDHAKEQAKAQYECIQEMIERLEHCQECSADYRGYKNNDDCDAEIEFNSEEEFDDYHDADKAREEIEEDPLSVQVRSGWASNASEFEAEDFEILLCTGGPACRIRGEIGEHNQPYRAWLEYQDWGTPWTQYFDADQSTLLTYSRCFYFGD